MSSKSVSVVVLFLILFPFLIFSSSGIGCLIPELNNDGVGDILDIFIIANSYGTCEGDENYNEKADLNGDNCITDSDIDYFLDCYNSNRGSVFLSDESGYKCPDVIRDGIINVFDILYVKSTYGKCEGDEGYKQNADFNRDNCITSTDLSFVLKFNGKHTYEIDQCRVLKSISVSASVAFFPHLLIDPFFAFWHIFGNYYVFIWCYAFVMMSIIKLIRFIRQ